MTLASTRSGGGRRRRRRRGRLPLRGSSDPVGTGVAILHARLRASAPSSHERRTAAGTAPAWRATAFPSIRITSVGTARMSKRAERRGDLSTSTLTSFTAPARSLAKWSRAGLTSRQGPHHTAQKSTSTGTGDSSAISVKSLSSASTIHGNSWWQFAHLGRPLALEGTRFGLPHRGQAVTLPFIAAPWCVVRCEALGTGAARSSMPGAGLSRALLDPRRPCVVPENAASHHSLFFLPAGPPGPEFPFAFGNPRQRLVDTLAAPSCRDERPEIPRCLPVLCSMNRGTWAAAVLRPGATAARRAGRRGLGRAMRRRQRGQTTGNPRTSRWCR